MLNYKTPRINDYNGDRVPDLVRIEPGILTLISLLNSANGFLLNTKQRPPAMWPHASCAKHY